MAAGKLKDKLGDAVIDPRSKRLWKVALWVLVVILLINIFLGWYWSREPKMMTLEVRPNAVTGETFTREIIRVSETLLEKPGGYLSNDVLPYSWWIDNMPNWEFGVIVQVRDVTRTMRRDISRSQSQSQEDRDLAIAEPLFNYDTSSWMLPSTENEYRRGVNALERYLDRLIDGDAVFFSRADNLNTWLAEVQSRLGSLSLQLSLSVGRSQLELDREGAELDMQLERDGEILKTPWYLVDDVFYEARGATWALVHLMRAAEVDFAPILRQKNATVSFRQVIRELEASQQPMRSPMVLNGSGFGIFPNHSLVMANYISRANAALLDLRRLLAEG